MAEIITGPLTDSEDSNIIKGPLGEESFEAESGEEEAEAQEEQEQEVFERKLVASTMVQEVAYEPTGEEVEVLFVNGKEESYACDKTTYEELINASSIGQFMHANFL